MSRPWFKFYGRDFREGVRGALTLEEAGAYAVILTLIYDTDNRVPDDERIMCAHLNVDPRVWRRVRARLIACKKLAVVSGFLTNLRATSELSMAQDIADVRRTSGRHGGQQSAKSRAKSRKTHDPPQASASNLPLYARGLSESESEETPSLRSGVSRPPPKTIGLDAVMSDAERTFAAGKGFVNGNADALWERFRAHHAAKGSKFAKPEAAWRTWVLNEIKFQGERDGNGVGAGFRFAGSQGPPARPQSRSAATIIMERALADEVGDDGGSDVFAVGAGGRRS